MTGKTSIDVRNTGPGAYDVSVRDGDGETKHRVTLSEAARQRLAGGKFSAEQCLEAAFRFLLDREAKESILGAFDISLISRYFPEFERVLPQYLGSAE